VDLAMETLEELADLAVAVEHTVIKFFKEELGHLVKVTMVVEVVLTLALLTQMEKVLVEVVVQVAREEMAELLAKVLE
jgi:nucleotide-binding universal stress UspA family protein